MESKVIIYEMLIGLYYRKGMAREAFNYAERAKSRAFLDLLSGVDLSRKEDLDPAVRGLIQREQELEKKVEFLTGDPRQPGAVIEHNEILRELARQYPDYASLKSASPIDIGDLQEDLDDQTAVVEYFVGSSSGYVFVVTDRSLGIKKIGPEPAKLCEKVDYYRKVIKRLVNYSDKELMELSRWFYTNLLEPVGTEIKGKRRLCIVPYGILHDLPFAAVALEQQPLRLLIDEHDVFYAPSASVYQLAHGRKKQMKEDAVIFAKSGFRDHRDWFDLPLPGTIKETDSIQAAKALPRLTIFSDADSSGLQPTETRAKEVLKDFDIIHFATHGKLATGDSALDSRVILSTDANNDGNLKVREIFNMDLDAYLVTLSACETGQLKGFSGGNYLVGDELTGLSRAFIYAGTPSVVASLWKVSDVSTALLMARFYKNLQGSDKTRALCDAQRWLRKKEYYDRPFFWAPFVVIGDWR
jgi:CHAT domain-containing protein